MAHFESGDIGSNDAMASRNASSSSGVSSSISKTKYLLVGTRRTVEYYNTFSYFQTRNTRRRRRFFCACIATIHGTVRHSLIPKSLPILPPPISFSLPVPFPLLSPHKLLTCINPSSKSVYLRGRPAGRP